MLSLCLFFLSTFGHFQDQFTTINAEVNYENHPYTRNTKLSDALTTDYIRFDIDFTELLNDISDYTQRQNAVVATQIAKEYLQSVLKVERVSGNLLIDRCLQYSADGSYCVNFYSNWIQNTMCDGLLDPQTCCKELTYYDSSGQHTLAAGSGYADTDIWIGVQAKYTSNCGQDTLMYAGACVRDQYNRPIAGTVNFCPNGLGQLGTNWGSSVATIVHELMHALGFTKESFSKFVDSSGKVLPESNVYQSFLERSHTVYKVVSPKVKAEVRNQFSCSTLDGAELEDDLGSGTALSHWEKRVFGNEIMVGVTDGYGAVVSRVTLAFFEDSGWYVPDYSKAGKLDYGNAEQCSFTTGYCLTKTTGDPINNYPNNFCTESGKTGCATDLGAVASCSIFQYNSALASYDQYFTSAYKGGSQVADFCPMWKPNSWNGDDFMRVCSDSSGYPNSNWHSQGVILGETYDEHARCVMSKVIKSGYVPGNEFKGACMGISCTSNTIYIKINGQTAATCGSSEEGTTKKISVSGYSGEIQCPNFDLTCAEQDCGIHGHKSGSSCVCDPGFYQPNSNSICVEKTSIGEKSKIETKKVEKNPKAEKTGNFWYAEKIAEEKLDERLKKEIVGRLFREKEILV